MKKTTILFKGFDCDLEVTVEKKEYLSLECAIRYILKDIPTAIIKGIIHHESEPKCIVNTK